MVREAIEKLAVEPGGHNDRLQELLSIVERLQALSDQLGDVEMHSADYARGTIDASIESLTLLADHAKTMSIRLN